MNITINTPKKILWSFFKDGVQLSQDYTANTRKILLFTTKSAGVPGTHLVDLRKMKGRVDLAATQCFLTETPGFSVLTTRHNQWA